MLGGCDNAGHLVVFVADLERNASAVVHSSNNNFIYRLWGSFFFKRERDFDPDSVCLLKSRFKSTTTL